MADKFQQFTPGLSSPPENAENVNPSDTTDLGMVSRCINTATSGTVRLTTISGDDVTLFVANGITFPIRARRIWASGTTATGIVALW